MRIAVPPIGGPRWLGGWNYLINLVSALAASGREDIETIVFLGEDVDPSRYAMLQHMPRTRVVISPAFDDAARQRRLIQALTWGIDRSALAAFRRERINVVFEPATFFGWRFPLPAVAWLADFQHLRMPHLFPRMSRWRRDIGFRAQVAAGRTIMLSSADAEHDALAAYPAARGRTRVARFAVRPVDILPDEEVERRVAPLALDSPYAILPNQLWVHKNHRIVIEALGKARARGSSLTIAATGAAYDPRAPELADELTRRIAADDLQRQFRILGMIPFAQLEALMQGAIGLINPSRFEGWSTPVEEGKLRGLPMLLSDIPVHHEQADGIAAFFDPDDANTLADLLLDLERDGHRLGQDDLRRARQAGEEAHRRFGNLLADIFQDSARDR